MSTFEVDGVEYQLIRNPYTNGPMITRADGGEVPNRKEICRRFLRQYGWTDEMFRNTITNELERAINKIVNDGKLKQPRLSSTLSKSGGYSREFSGFARKSPASVNIPKPNRDEVLKWIEEWNKLEDYVAQEKAIERVFHNELKSNDDLTNILIKCSVLNDFYSTHIFKIYPLAKHILNLDIDGRLNAGDPDLVNDIAEVDFGDVEKNFYSFATKYCSHHRPDKYAIYDSYVDKMLVHFRNVDRFALFEAPELKVYSRFKEILDQFQAHYGLQEFDLKQLDRYLWRAGKHYFPKKYY